MKNITLTLLAAAAMGTVSLAGASAMPFSNVAVAPGDSAAQPTPVACRYQRCYNTARSYRYARPYYAPRAYNSYGYGSGYGYGPGYGYAPSYGYGRPFVGIGIGPFSFGL